MNYPKIYRIPVPGYRTRGKHYLTPEEVDKLLSTKVVVEEKIDGKLDYKYICNEIIVYGEYMKYVHNIKYTRLPASFIGLDVYGTYSNQLFNLPSKHIFLRDNCIPSVHVICEGILSIDDLLGCIGIPSAYGAARIEGIVVKNYELGMYGKIVDPIFEDELDDSEHWTDKPRLLNTIVGY